MKYVFIINFIYNLLNLTIVFTVYLASEDVNKTNHHLSVMSTTPEQTSGQK